MKLRSLALVLVAACGSKAGTGSGASGDAAATITISDDRNVLEDRSWKRIEPGVWEMRPYYAETPTLGLTAEPGGRGILVIDLPEGATGAELISVSAHYQLPGSGTWTVYPANGDDGDATGDPMGSVEFVLGDDDVSGQDDPKWTTSTFVPPVEVKTRFHLVYEVTKGQPHVFADETQSERAYYQPPGTPPQPTPYSAHVRVRVSHVH